MVYQQQLSSKKPGNTRRRGAEYAEGRRVEENQLFVFSACLRRLNDLANLNLVIARQNPFFYACVEFQFVSHLHKFIHKYLF